jgi:uncharacterized protein YjfI (DUF2170 family)
MNLVIVHTNETSLVEYLNSFDFGDLPVVKLSGLKNLITQHKLITVLEVQNQRGYHYLNLMMNILQFGLKMF